MPTFFWSAVDMLARAAIPAALFGLGGVLYQYRPEGDMKAIAMAVFITLIIHPAITYGLGTNVFRLTTEQLRSAVVTAAMAPGVNAYLFSNMYGAARRVAASTVLLATAATIFTAWGWLQILP
jgi:predicted permease